MNQKPGDPIESLTEVITKVGGLNERDVDRIAVSPFLYARIRSGIEAEQRRRAEQGDGWFSTILIPARAMGVLLLITIATVMAFWVTRAKAPIKSVPNGAGGDGISRVVAGGTCALSTADECAISSEEVLATLFANKGEEEPK